MSLPGGNDRFHFGDGPRQREEHGNSLLAGDAVTGLLQALAGKFLFDEKLDGALGVSSTGSP